MAWLVAIAIVCSYLTAFACCCDVLGSRKHLATTLLVKVGALLRVCVHASMCTCVCWLVG